MLWRLVGVLGIVLSCVALVVLGPVDGTEAARSEPGAAARAAVARSDAVVTTEPQLRRAWADPTRTRIDLGADIALRDCVRGDPMRESPYPMLLDGHGHTIRQTCFEKRVLRQDGTGWLDIRDVTLTRGGSDGPGAALTSRGEIVLQDCVIKQNLAEEPGGGVFSMRRVTVHRCRINGNLANDDGGAVYARRGGVQVYDSVLSTNLVDGSGGAIATTGDILLVRSWVDGNTTDGDGGALYADEDGDVTVVDSIIDGSDADGPGGAIFTLDGDVAVYDSTLNGNRADDRGGAISGEADVLVVNSTVGRNLAVAHAGGGIWARGDLVLVNSTVSRNYAEGDGGGTLSAGRTTIIGSTLLGNIASVGGDIGSAGRLDSFASIIGPPTTEGVTGDTIPTSRSCRVYGAVSRGYNHFSATSSCELDHPTDVVGEDPQVEQVDAHPLGYVLVPRPGSPVIDRIPSGSCVGELPDPLPAGQLLDGWVDWEQVLRRDALGAVRDDGVACDIGAVQSGAVQSGAVQSGAVTPSVRRPDVPPLGPEAPPARATASERPAVRLERPRGTRGALDRLGRRLRQLDRESRRFEVLLGCTTRVGVDRAGDARNRWGFLYDERDGTGLHTRSALVRHSGKQRPRWYVLRLSTARRCLSAPADPNGAGDDARPGHRSLAAQVRRLQRLAKVVEARTERFDAWESCLSWLPLTESGDDEQDLGYLVDQGLWPFVRVHYPAVDLDHSEWDDPDYQVLAFRGRDHPFGPGECGTDPGEDADRPGRELRQDIASLREDVEDLAEPVDEIARFDECLFTVGVTSAPGYVYRTRGGQERRRSALSFDMSGPQLPAMSLMAFPGEEPPQIECNEDAGGVQTHE